MHRDNPSPAALTVRRRVLVLERSAMPEIIGRETAAPVCRPLTLAHQRNRADGPRSPRACTCGRR
jgi:hypothetical protein